MAELNNNNSTCVEPNDYESWIDTEFYLVVVFGTTVALLSTVENLVLFYVLLTRSKFRTSNLFYMTWIAFFDIFIGVSFVLLLTVKVLYDYLPSVFLHRIWHTYFREVFTVCHVSLAASTFLIISATVERFLAIQIDQKMYKFVEKNRSLLTILSIFLGVALKGTIYLEYTILVDENCWNRARHLAYPSDLALTNWYYAVVWQFYARHILVVFLPFIVLMYMNVRIVNSLRKSANSAAENVRTATRMMVLIVTIYLLTNVLNLVITAWEHVDKASLDSEELSMFHVYAADVTTILTVAAGASRLPIYVWLNRQIRAELKAILFCCFIEQRKLPKSQSSESTNFRYRNGTPCNAPQMIKSTSEKADENQAFVPNSFSDSAVVLIDNGVHSELIRHH